MRTDHLLDEMVARIRQTGHPECVVLFGSRARGEERADSDYDLLVIQESDEPRYRRSIPLYAVLADLPAEVEIMVYTPAEVREWSEVREAFVTTAMREGKLVYEKKA